MGFDAKTLAEYFGYLDDLRKSGRMNMLGSGPYLAAVYGLEPREGAKVVGMWMKTFGTKKDLKARVASAILSEAGKEKEGG